MCCAAGGGTSDYRNRKETLFPSLSFFSSSSCREGEAATGDIALSFSPSLFSQLSLSLSPAGRIFFTWQWDPPPSLSSPPSPSLPPDSFGVRWSEEAVVAARLEGGRRGKQVRTCAVISNAMCQPDFLEFFCEPFYHIGTEMSAKFCPLATCCPRQKKENNNAFLLAHLALNQCRGGWGEGRGRVGRGSNIFCLLVCKLFCCGTWQEAGGREREHPSSLPNFSGLGQKREYDAGARMDHPPH